MNKFLLLCALITLIITTGCAPKREFVSRNLKLPLDNFTRTENTPLANSFISYAKECSYGIFASAEKLADLYKSTLSKKSPNYLYFQQEVFAKPFTTCNMLVSDTIKTISSPLTTYDGKEFKHSYTPYEIEAANKAYLALEQANVTKVDKVLEIIYDFYSNKQYKEANHWIRHLNRITLGDAHGFFTLGKYFFDKDEPHIKAYGYQLLEASAKLSYKEALILIDTKPYRLYRADKPKLQENFRAIIYQNQTF